MSFLGVLFQAIVVQNLMLNYMIGFDISHLTTSFKEISKISVYFLLLCVVLGLPMWVVNNFILVPFELDFLRLILLGLISLIPYALLKKMSLNNRPQYIELLYSLLVWGTILIMMIQEAGFVSSLSLLLAGPIGFFLVNFILHGMHQKLSLVNLPTVLKGWPVRLLTAGILSLIFASIDHVSLNYFV